MRSRVVRRYDDDAPGWIMGDRDRHFVGDFNGDGKDDLYVQNVSDWGTLYVGMMRSNGNTLQTLVVHGDDLDGWIMASGDTLYVGDFNGDGRDDLYVFNGHSWDNDYLGMFRSTGSNVDFVRLYTNEIPGWDLEQWDSFKVADIDGDGDDDLYVKNNIDWNHRYIGILRAGANNTLSGKFFEKNVGLYGFNQNDWLLPADFTGDGRDDLFIRDPNWFGTAAQRRTTTSAFERKYYHWIHNFLYYSPLGHSSSNLFEGI